MNHCNDHFLSNFKKLNLEVEVLPRSTLCETELEKLVDVNMLNIISKYCRNKDIEEAEKFIKSVVEDYSSMIVVSIMEVRICLLFSQHPKDTQLLKTRPILASKVTDDVSLESLTHMSISPTHWIKYSETLSSWDLIRLCETF